MGNSFIEWLLTYGWAIIVILAVIGVLAYFRFIDPIMLKAIARNSTNAAINAYK